MKIDQYTSKDNLTTYLKNKIGFLKLSEIINEIEIAGEGNMNVVLRIKTNKRTFILKQSRPFVQKYPDLPAPIDRINVEKKFYDLMDQNSFFPEILGYLPSDYILLIEDLGKGEDLTSLYNTRRITSDLIKEFTLGLYYIHKKKAPADYPENIELRKLNHDHIFELPFKENNSFNLDHIQKGLENLSNPFKKNNSLKEKVLYAGKIYLEKGNTLLHGDYYPGSWMRVGDNNYVIDPEFSFVGPKAFDLGVMSAHIIIASGKTSFLEEIYNMYPAKAEFKKISLYCGIEIIRRLIGLAQLPIKRSLMEKKELLNFAEELILS
jgi:5-methylthioribose kinase